VPDSRTGKRFPLELPIRIHEANSAQEMEGTTGNVSSAGVYVRANAPWKVGSRVEFEITLPAEAAASKHDVQIKCRGRVVRVDKTTSDSPADCGVACVIDKYEFVRE
jgi:hypothetical protein